MKKTLFILLFLGIISNLYGQTIIPSPETMSSTEEKFEIKKNVVSVYMQKSREMPTALLCSKILFGTNIRRTSNIDKADIRFLIDTNISHEGYLLNINPLYIEIKAFGQAGFVYALQTLRQMKKLEEPAWDCVTINDHPRMKWRGFMLDSGRQYQSVATIKKYIDMGHDLCSLDR